MGNVADTEKRGCTLVRTVVGLCLRAASPGVVSGQQRVTIGIALVSDDAFSASAVPDVEDAADFPVQGWLWREVRLVYDETLATGIINPVEVRLDLRAARKLDRSSMVLLMSNENLEGTGFDVRVLGLIRSLYKLP